MVSLSLLLPPSLPLFLSNGMIGWIVHGLSGVVSSSGSNVSLNGGVVRMRAPPSLSFDGSTTNRKRPALDPHPSIAHKNGRFFWYVHDLPSHPIDSSTCLTGMISQLQIPLTQYCDSFLFLLQLITYTLWYIHSITIYSTLHYSILSIPSHYPSLFSLSCF